jgi:hypothetical protein
MPLPAAALSMEVASSTSNGSTSSTHNGAIASLLSAGLQLL